MVAFSHQFGPNENIRLAGLEVVVNSRVMRFFFGNGVSIHAQDSGAGQEFTDLGLNFLCADAEHSDAGRFAGAAGLRDGRFPAAMVATKQRKFWCCLVMDIGQVADRAADYPTALATKHEIRESPPIDEKNYLFPAAESLSNLRQELLGNAGSPSRRPVDDLDF